MIYIFYKSYIKLTLMSKLTVTQKKISLRKTYRAQKTSSSKYTPKIITKIVRTIKKSPIKVGLATLGVLATGYALNKIKNYYKKTVSLSSKINTEDDAIKVIFNPAEVGLWNGDLGIASIFLNEYLYKLPNVCDTKKYKNYRIAFSPNGEMYIQKDGKNPIPVTSDEMKLHFKEVINYSECASKRFFIIPINVLMTKPGVNELHANSLIYDSTNKSMDHYEPYGSHEYITDIGRGVYYLIGLICDDLGIKYNNPNISCPRFGPQMLESIQCPILRLVRNNFKTDIGYCGVWSLFYVELRLKNPDIPSKVLIKKATDNLGINLCNFITAYASNILKFSKKFDLVLDDKGLVIDYKEKTI